MSAAALLEMPTQHNAPPPRQARLDALRQAAQRGDPVRLHYVDVLSQRIATAPEAVRRVLETRLDTALTDLEQRLCQPQAPAREQAAHLSAAPLVALNQYIRGLKQQDDGHASGPGLESGLGRGLTGNTETRTEMASVHRFREAWSRIAAEDQVIEAVERGPANAGPLNSHMLVLRTLALLRKQSPDYLRRFLSHVETLQWLEQASQNLTPVKAKPARRSRAKK